MSHDNDGEGIASRKGEAAAKSSLVCAWECSIAHLKFGSEEKCTTRSKEDTSCLKGTEPRLCVVSAVPLVLLLEKKDCAARPACMDRIGDQAPVHPSQPGTSKMCSALHWTRATPTPFLRNPSDPLASARILDRVSQLSLHRIESWPRLTFCCYRGRARRWSRFSNRVAVLAGFYRTASASSPGDLRHVSTLRRSDRAQLHPFDHAVQQLR